MPTLVVKVRSTVDNTVIAGWKSDKLIIQLSSTYNRDVWAASEKQNKYPLDYQNRFSKKISLHLHI